MFGHYSYSDRSVQMHCITVQYVPSDIVKGIRSVYACLYSGHSVYNLGLPVLTLNLSSCDLRPQFLITFKVFVSLCNKNQFVCLCKSTVICTCYFKKRPRVSFDSCCLAFIFMLLIFTSIGRVSVGLSINTFYPHRTNNTDIKCFFFFLSQQSAATNKTRTTHLFICLGNIKTGKRLNFHWSYPPVGLGFNYQTH